MQLNAAMSLMQSYGSDIGGFCGDSPSPELFVRWVQLGVTHSRFCIHSNTRTKSGAPKLTLPWMVSLGQILLSTVSRSHAYHPKVDQMALRSAPVSQ